MKLYSSLKRLVLAVLAAIMLITGTATAAMAEEAGNASSVTHDACGNPAYVETDSGHPAYNASEEVDPTEASSSMLLPANRWGESVGTFYSNLDSGMFEFNLRQQSREQIGGFFFSSSSNIWEGTLATSVWATAFCPIDAVGHQIDTFLGTFGDALLDAGMPLIIALLVGLAVVAAWGSRKGTGFAMNWKDLIGKLAIMAVFILMVQGARDSNMDNEEWNPSGLSPGNIVKTTNTVISDFGGAVNQGLMSVGQDGSYARFGISEGQQTTDCRVAIASMHGAYESTFSGPEHTGLASQIPVAVSDAWVNSVYVGYSRAQQGPYRPGDDGTQTDYDVENGSTSPHHYSTCYILDWTSPTPITTGEAETVTSDSRAMFLGRPMGGYFSEDHTYDDTAESGLWFRVDLENADNVLRWGTFLAPHTTIPDGRDDDPVATMQERALAFWSTCRVGSETTITDMESDDHWRVADGFASGAGQPVTAEQCASWWRAQGYVRTDDGDSLPPGFDLDSGEVNDYGLPEYETEYIHYLNGVNPMGAIGAGFITLIASMVLFVIFGAIGLVVVVARAALLIVMIYMFVTALVALLPGQGFAAILKAFKMLIGIVMLSVFAQVLYSVIIGFSTALNAVGSTFLEFGSVGYIGWIAITPLLALVGIHFVFKWAKLPSPMTVNGAKAWSKGMANEGGSAAGGAFGGAGGGGGTKSAMNNVSKGYRDASLNRAVDRTGSREGQMEEAGREAQQKRGVVGNAMAGYGAGGISGAVGGMMGGRKSQSAPAGPGGRGGAGEESQADTSVGGGGAKGAGNRAKEAVMADEAGFEGQSRTEQKRVAQEASRQAKKQYKADAQSVRKARRAEQRKEFEDKYLSQKLGADGKRRLDIGGSLAKTAGNGLDAIKSRGVKGNLKTAAKIAGVGAVASGVGTVPAAAIVGAWGAKKFASSTNRGLASYGMGTKDARDQFSHQVGDYVAAGRKSNRLNDNENAQAWAGSQVAAAGNDWEAGERRSGESTGAKPTDAAQAAGWDENVPDDALDPDSGEQVGQMRGRVPEPEAKDLDSKQERARKASHYVGPNAPKRPGGQGNKPVDGAGEKAQPESEVPKPDTGSPQGRPHTRGQNPGADRPSTGQTPPAPKTDGDSGSHRSVSLDPEGDRNPVGDEGPRNVTPRESEPRSGPEGDSAE